MKYQNDSSEPKRKDLIILLIILLILMFGKYAKAQVYPMIGTVSEIRLISKPDTQKVIMLICDTSSIEYKSKDIETFKRYDPKVYWMFGYVVNVPNKPFIYLNINKDYLPVNYVVWISKEY